MYVEGLREVELPDLEAATQTVQLGWTQRSSASNGLNDASSRSHAVLSLKLLKATPGSASPAVATRLCVVDLAGAERQKKTQANGARLNEVHPERHSPCSPPPWRAASLLPTAPYPF